MGTVLGVVAAVGLLGVVGVGAAGPPGCNQVGNGEITQPGTTQQQRNDAMDSQGSWVCTWNPFPTG